jgi:hypothetical protein
MRTVMAEYSIGLDLGGMYLGIAAITRSWGNAWQTARGSRRRPGAGIAGDMQRPSAQVAGRSMAAGGPWQIGAVAPGPIDQPRRA